MSSRLGDLALKAAGILLMLAAAGFAVSKAPDRSLESLVPRWAPPPSDFIELDGQLVHYRDQGPASDPLPLVLLHGTGASLHTWEAWATALSPTRRVLSFDLPGFGLTGPAADGDYRDERYVAFTRRLLTQLRVERAVLSAIRWAARSPGSWRWPTRRAWPGSCWWTRAAMPPRPRPRRWGFGSPSCRCCARPCAGCCRAAPSRTAS